MIGEFEIAGVFLPAVLGVGIVAFLVTNLIRRVLRALGVYAFVWHAGLFDVAAFAAIWWLTAYLSDTFKA